ncbi:OmpA family protein [Persicobacter psychrovividus]|uniref:OmpA-like domain-containing protein n=1 Tax=Persicobacter psychrovividus TaxID=387638 RepID=A0ABM7VH71_9BACT|nr:hypothetical protein PEPS_25740 [Persicobacter psychrovividus]
MRFIFYLLIAILSLSCAEECKAQSFNQFSIRHKTRYHKPKRECKKGRKKKRVKYSARRKKVKATKKDYKVVVVSTPTEAPKSRVVTTPPVPQMSVPPTELKHQPELAKVSDRILPEPINPDHARIREMIDKREKSGGSPDEMVESLYFITGQDEFAYVNFDPFLIAVEYALRGAIVLVEGYTDSIGKEEDNLQLSMKRVRQIERLMIEIGVRDEQISVIGYGEENPTYDNSTEEGRQKNRRVDFKIFMPQNE